MRCFFIFLSLFSFSIKVRSQRILEEFEEEYRKGDLDYMEYKMSKIQWF